MIPFPIVCAGAVLVFMLFLSVLGWLVQGVMWISQALGVLP